MSDDPSDPHAPSDEESSYWAKVYARESWYRQFAYAIDQEAAKEVGESYHLWVPLSLIAKELHIIRGYIFWGVATLGVIAVALVLK